VLQLAGELGVDPAKIGSFGPYYFPYNYYEHLFASFERDNGRPPRRSEVEQLVQGYVATCGTNSSSVVYYIYYSTQTHLAWGGEIAMAMMFGYELPPPAGPAPENPALTFMQPVELWDGSVNPRHETYWDNCIQEYLNRQ